ncbi:phenoloxidase-activating factor 2-like [Ischnura elegans]|uniref:phenoloxidase-activating factor 2-like n=1 Tax=Ischnura elegans TaxID=197161 RepID=UPI001ED8B2E1|nr:phenoloxidase-activating factor 2-like [Ischnura elegans]
MNRILHLLCFVGLLVLSAADQIPKTDDCECVPYYQCTNGSIIEDGASLIDVRRRVVGCENYLDVCCKTPSIKHEPQDEGREEEANDFEDSVYDCIGPCGVHRPKGVAFRIQGATDGEAQFGEFPWMAALLQKTEGAPKKGLRRYLCGASLIHPRVVLTGAHCVHGHNISSLVVRAGEWDSQTKKEIYPHQDREVAKVIIHPYFQKKNLFNDAALVILSAPFKPAKHIGFICLPQQGEVPQPATHCIASGWGRENFVKEGGYSAILKRVDLPVVERSNCQRNLRTTRLGAYFKLHQSFICAGGEEGKDTCKGDGGSPLVCPHPDEPERYVQSGIVAWGIGCMSKSPGVYVNVALFRDWIDEQMHENDLDTTFYSL